LPFDYVSYIILFYTLTLITSLQDLKTKHRHTFRQGCPNEGGFISSFSL
jgi:hypothetical protein